MRSARALEELGAEGEYAEERDRADAVRERAEKRLAEEATTGSG
ncbi:hypothetical protein ACFQGT_02360 [Natrialbaceae archaeon GCM10025810]